jgi:hypothetical protein
MTREASKPKAQGASELLISSVDVLHLERRRKGQKKESGQRITN